MRHSADTLSAGACAVDEIEKFLSERRRQLEELDRIDRLILQYKKKTPDIESHWDVTPQSIAFNDINDKIASAGICIYECDSDALWSGLYEPGIYEAHTLWKEVHDKRKIAKVIEAWSLKTALSPVFLVKHGALDLGLVADGKHRLTVARAIGATQIPFMAAKGSAWVDHAIPSARLITLT